MTNNNDRTAHLQPHQQEFHKVLVEDFEQLSIKYRNTFVTELEHRDRARYAQLDEIRRQTDARHDALVVELQDLVTAVQGVAAALGKFERRLSAVERSYSESKQDRADLRAVMEAHEAEIKRLTDRVFGFDLPDNERQQMNATLFEMLAAWPDLQATLTQIRVLLETADANQP